MSSGADEHSRILQSFRFAGSSSGLVKSLGGFKKSHHTVPDSVTPATSAFLAKLCAPELSEEGENMFQRARALLSYKRKDLTLDVASGTAVLAAKDFVFELTYRLREEAPDEYLVTRSMHSVRRADFLLTTECDELFDGLFDQVVFVLTKGAPVEAVIDAVESLEEDSMLSVDYPSDCRTCTLRVSDVAAEVSFDGQELGIRFPRTATPQKLWADFLAVRHAFALTRKGVLAGLVGG